MSGATRIVRVAIAVGLFALLGASFGNANSQVTLQDGASLPAASSVAKPHAYVSLDEVPAGHPFEIAVVVDILAGYHMNSHTPSEDYLIPTALSLAPTPGFRETGSTYPDGQMLKFDFSPEKLSVYSGSVTIRVKLTVDASAAQSEATLPFTLRYQACNMSACLPPAKVPFSVKVKVAAADAKPHALHPEIFKSPSK